MKSRVRALAVAFILAAACSSGGGTGPDDGGNNNGGNNNGGNNNGGGNQNPPNTVTVGAITFSPNLTVPVNTKVTWVSESVVAHSITPENPNQAGAWQAVEFSKTGTVLEHTFTVANQTYRYRCIFHSSNFTAGMVGTIVVQG
jgi:plastocyanin